MTHFLSSIAYPVCSLLGFVIVWRASLAQLSRSKYFSRPDPISPGDLASVMTVLPMAYIVGGRVGYMIIQTGGSNTFLDWISVWNGGLSSTGSIAAVGVSILLVSRFNIVKALQIADLISFSAPLAICLIRFGSFVHGDLVGVETSHPLLRHLSIAQHPTAIYEAVIEGLALYVFLSVCVKQGALRQAGLLSSIFILGYSNVRFALDNFRQHSDLSNAFSIYEYALLIFIGLALFFVGMALRSAKTVKARTAIYPRASGYLRNVLLPSASILTVSAVVGGCGGSPRDKVPNVGVANPVTITYTNPDGDKQQCPCATSQGVYAENISSVAQQIAWVIYGKDTLSGQILTPINGSGPVPQGGSSVPGKLFLGCTIYAPATSCRFQAKYELRQRSSLLSTPTGKWSKYGSVATPSIATCTSWCSEPDSPNSGACLPLGVRYYKAVAPIAEMIKAASQTSGTIIKKADVMAKYGLSPSQETCGRGDLTVKDGVATNEGTTEACQIASDDLPTATLKALNIEAAAANPTKMITVLPQKVEGSKGTAMAALNASETATFDNIGTAPYFTFDGAGAESLTQNFGGSVLGAARINRAGYPNQTVVATANGCIAVDEP